MVFSCSIITALIAAGAASSALAVPINARDLDDRRFDNVGEPHWQSSHRHHEDQFGGPRHRHHELLGEDEFEFEFEEHHPHSHHQGDDEFLRITMSKEGLVLSITTTIPTTLIYVHHHQAEVVSVSLEQKKFDHAMGMPYKAGIDETTLSIGIKHAAHPPVDLERRASDEQQKTEKLQQQADRRWQYIKGDFPKYKKDFKKCKTFKEFWPTETGRAVASLINDHISVDFTDLNKLDRMLKTKDKQLYEVVKNAFEQSSSAFNPNSPLRSRRAS
ncbi:hypothetical protein GG344DRAFT_75691 [Lentinula edodes]|nr:hypothetical protein GG344DRAFT_75691 [Lentinula edodes]